MPERLEDYDDVQRHALRVFTAAVLRRLMDEYDEKCQARTESIERCARFTAQLQKVRVV